MLTIPKPPALLPIINSNITPMGWPEATKEIVRRDVKKKHDVRFTRKEGRHIGKGKGQRQQKN